MFQGTQASGNEGHFMVNPTLKICGNPIAVGQLCIQTILTKSWGPIANWESHFLEAARTGTFLTV